MAILRFWPTGGGPGNAVSGNISGTAAGASLDTGSAGFVVSMTGTSVGTSLDTITTIVLDWQLATGHYEPAAFSLAAVYPRPDEETNSYARHRNAYPSMKYEVRICVSGGSAPFRCELFDDDGATWLSIEEETLTYNGTTGTYEVGAGYCWLSGTAPASGGPWTVVVRVYDQEHGRPSDSYIDLTWTITLSTSAFCFLDSVNGSDSTGDGSLGAPYQSVTALIADGSFGDKICVVLGNSYTSAAPDDIFNACGTGEPSAYIAEDRTDPIVIDGSDMIRFGSLNSPEDPAFTGFTVNDLYANQPVNPGTGGQVGNVRAIYTFGQVDRLTVSAMEFNSPNGGTVGTDNPTCIWLPDSTNHHTYIAVVDVLCTDLPDAGNGTSLITAYSVHGFLYEHLTADTAWDYAIFPKGSHQFGSVRLCDTLGGNCSIPLYNAANAGTTQGDHDPDGYQHDVEICYCRIENTNTNSLSGAIYCNGSSSKYTYGDENIHIYRNSIKHNVRFRYNDTLPSPNAPAEWYTARNMIYGTGNWNPDERSTLIDPTASDGDVLTTSDPFDASMNLTGTPRTTYLGTHGAEIA